MELILDIFWEKHRVYIEWKQIICAVLLALLIAGMYNYINAQSDYAEEFMKEQTVSAKSLPAKDLSMIRSFKIETFPDILLLPKENIKEEVKRRKSESYPEAAAKAQNFAVGYGYSESEEEEKSKNVKPSKKVETKAVSSNVETKADDNIKHVTETVPNIPVTDVITGNPDIVAGRKGNDSNMENGKTGLSGADVDKIVADTNWADADRTNADMDKAEPDRIVADTERIDVGSADTNRTESDSAGTDSAEDDIVDTDKSDIKPVILWERFPGFLTDEKGHIAGYTDASKVLKDHLVVFPINAACTGVEKDALKGLETDIYEIYIPANITYIAEGAFDELMNLYYIEAASDNPRFYSENGILYYRNGKVAVYPNRIRKE